MSVVLKLSSTLFEVDDKVVLFETFSSAKDVGNFNHFNFVIVYGFMCFGSGSFDLMDNGLMGMMLGPETSRPFVQSLHAFAAVGFALSKQNL